MPRPVYFDTSVFLDILAKNSPNRNSILELLNELQDRKVTIYTSILTVEEASVLSYRKGHVPHDNHRTINKLARIWGIDKTIALTTAKHEADIRDLCKESNDASEKKHRRRWDCFHIATAQVRECTHLYTTDPHFTTRHSQLSLPDLIIAFPKPTSPMLPFTPNSGPVLVK